MALNGFEAVIFDIGGVLTTSPVLSIKQYAESIGRTQADFRPLFAGEDSAWSRYERSDCTQEEFITGFEADARALGFTVDGRAFLNTFFGGSTPREEMLAAVRALRGQVGLGCITNNVRTDTPRAFPLEELFDVVVESSRVNMRKPDPRIYLYTCERLGVAPERCIFLDDFGVNLKSAKALGMTTIKVDETRSGLDELERRLGLTLAPAGGNGGK